jgi:hypothetical protein
MERSDGNDVRIDVRIGNHAQHAVGRSQGKRFMFIPASALREGSPQRP